MTLHSKFTANLHSRTPLRSLLIKVRCRNQTHEHQQAPKTCCLNVHHFPGWVVIWGSCEKSTCLHSYQLHTVGAAIQNSSAASTQPTVVHELSALQTGKARLGFKVPITQLANTTGRIWKHVLSAVPLSWQVGWSVARSEELRPGPLHRAPGSPQFQRETKRRHLQKACQICRMEFFSATRSEVL